MEDTSTTYQPYISTPRHLPSTTKTDEADGFVIDVKLNFNDPHSEQTTRKSWLSKRQSIDSADLPLDMDVVSPKDEFGGSHEVRTDP